MRTRLHRHGACQNRSDALRPKPASHTGGGTRCRGVFVTVEKSKVKKWPRRIRDLLGSALAAFALIALLVSIDGRAREGFGRVASDVSHARWSAPIASVVADVSADPRFENMFLISFVGAAVVLTLLMFRT